MRVEFAFNGTRWKLLKFIVVACMHTAIDKHLGAIGKSVNPGLDSGECLFIG